ncbi:CapA family protein [Dermacoccaceae bacterium W4C1]
MARGNRTIIAAASAAAVLSSCSLPFSDDTATSAARSQAASASTGGTSAGSASSSGPTTVTVSSSGDILVHVPVQASAQELAKETGSSAEYDFNPMFDGVRAKLSASDVAICHQETPISATNDDLSRPGSLIYNVPSQIAPALKKAGFDGCETSSNHVWDRGAKGIDTTNAQLKKAGLKVAGPTTDANTPGMPAIYDVKGVKVANLSYSYTVLNQAAPNTNVPPGQAQLSQYLWPKLMAAGIIADAKKARAAGADLVVLSMHWGTEYVKQPTADQTELANKLLKSPEIDGIFGTHAHLIQPCSTINGKTVFYGLGNFLSNQGPGTVGTLGPDNADGAIATFTFTRGKDGRWSQKASFQPTMVHLKDQHRIKLSTPDSDADSYRRTTSAMHHLGDCSATPTEN